MAYPRAHQPHPGSEGLWSGTHSAISSRLLPESNRITVKICMWDEQLKGRGTYFPGPSYWQGHIRPTSPQLKLNHTPRNTWRSSYKW